MQLGIKAKFIGILLIASAVPLAIGVVTVWSLGYRDYQQKQGLLFEAAASHLALGLAGTIQSHVEELEELTTISTIADLLLRQNDAQPQLADTDFRARIEQVESRWPQLETGDAELQAVLTNNMARLLASFREARSHYAEIFVTDIRGQLVASTGKTTDYWQADERWWQQAFALAPRQAHLEGVQFDASARVHSIDIALPLFDPAAPSRPIGVIKAVLNTSPLFFSVTPILDSDEPVRQFVQADGRILVSLAGHQQVLPLQGTVGQELTRQLTVDQPGWTVVEFDDGTPRLVGYAPVKPTGLAPLRVKATGLSPLYVVVHQDLTTVMFPIRRQFWMLGAAGAVLLLIFSCLGLFITTRKIIRPIRTLRLAAQAVAAGSRPGTPSPSAQPVDLMLRQVGRIDTGDEIESLAKDFLVMATRVLRYHDQLKDEIAVKTAEIQRDLDVAREFQEALMPRTYPEVRSPPGADAISLNFHHVYMPTSSVGGDFFDVVKLSDHRAAIFIADVMGHGARSALVTAILRTLLQDLASQAGDPATFMAALNRHFSTIIKESNQFIFVSAFYLLIDTERAVATYASAGHPSPLVLDRGARQVSPLIEHLENNPALGLFPDSTYANFSRPIRPNDMFLLFTDGIFEPINDDGEEFGRDRLQRVVAEHLDQNAHDLTHHIIEAVEKFCGNVSLADDICLVACEIRPAEKGRSHPAATEAAVA